MPTIPDELYYNYYSYADYTIKLKSKQNYPPGSFVKVSENGMGSLIARIIKKQTFLNKAYQYELEAVSEFSPAEIKTHFYRNSSKVIRGLQGEKGEQGIPGKNGKDGTTKFLASLTVSGDYENQIGTFQGLLYRWSNSNWELLNAVMPVNPICAYDVADVQYKDVTQTRLRGFSYKFLAGISYSQYSKQATDALLNGKRYRITADFEVLQGEAKFATMYYYDFTTPQPWGTALYQSHTPVVNRRCTCVLEFVCKNTDLQGHDLRILFYNGREGAIQPNGISKWSNFKIETIADPQALDLSGNGNHANIAGNVEKRKDDKIGTILKCHNGYLARPAQNYIGVGKKWSHSRWVKIDQNKQDETKTSYLWYYGRFDYGLFAIKDLNGIPPAVWQVTYKNWENQCYTTIAKNTLLDNTWHHLVVMTDLQETYVRKITYLDGQKIGDVRKDGDFSNLASCKLHSEMNLEGDYTIGSLSNLIFFDRLLTEQEALWVYLNPQYPIKNYTTADWLIDKDNPDNVIAIQTPRYLGTVNVAPDGQNVFITNGSKTGTNTANIGDWILVINHTIPNYKKGWCYRWTGSEWKILDPQTQYQKEYTACLKDHFEKCGDMYSNEPQMFGALFCQFLAFNKAFGNFLEVKKLKVDNDSNNPKDFELSINKDVGILAKNNGKKIFELSPNGKATFSGEINCNGFQVLNTNTPNNVGNKLFEWKKGANGHDAARKIEKVNIITVPSDYEIKNPLITRYYGIGTYGGDTIRCVRVEKYKLFSLTRVDVFLLNEDGEEKGRFGSYAKEDGTPYIEPQGGFSAIPPYYTTSPHSFTFYDYIPQQKICLPNVSYGKQSQEGVLYRDENGFLKIS